MFQLNENIYMFCKSMIIQHGQFMTVNVYWSDILDNYCSHLNIYWISLNIKAFIRLCYNSNVSLGRIGLIWPKHFCFTEDTGNMVNIPWPKTSKYDIPINVFILSKCTNPYFKFKIQIIISNHTSIIWSLEYYYLSLLWCIITLVYLYY